MSDYAYVLIGGVRDDDEALGGLRRALGQLAGPSARRMQVSDTATVELVEDPLPAADHHPDYAGTTHQLRVLDTASAGDDGLDAQRATARRVYDALAAATEWKVVLVHEDWDGAAAVREALPSAA